ncbi:hypothetical protein PPERSA_08312 [Pseudocohnilembus persalinus]|uniref:Sperm-tail PG-rich repeat n=1 Tax=Pseudocohnilembus persalinus TaxID=266149 RepID=A0A0V0QPP2_PSEPJ|nr:hypothetical protein PPERSA_08312 [Pseudocohnilembus persalinus]|eukprot:KRX04097.1 hypothetical protein PPERSA_08312 [Pseudocohnilembus persalinus]
MEFYSFNDKKQEQQGIKYSIGKSKRNDEIFVKKNQLEDPGAQSYYPSIENIKKKQQQWVFGSEKRDTCQFFKGYRSCSPGPGFYKPEVCYKNVFKKGEAFSLGLKLPPKISETQTFPGPNVYNYNKGKYLVEKNFQASFTLRDRYEEVNNFLGNKNSLFKNEIGPASYCNQNSSVKKIHSAKIGKETRENNWKRGTNYDNNNPGPGEYQIKSNNDKNIPAWKFNNGERFDYVNKIFQDKQNKIGPGSYKIPVQVPNTKFYKSISPASKQQYSGKLKVKNQRDQDLPGPSQYLYEKSLEKIMKKSPSQKIGRAKRDYHPGNKENQNFMEVGPGRYENNKFDNKNSVKVSFGKEEKFRQTAENNICPGPGNYEIASKDLGGRKYKLAGKLGSSLENKNKVKNPAPNYYSPDYNKIQSKFPKHKIGTSVRKDINLTINDNPAPGSYQIDTERIGKKSNNNAFQFGKAQRFKQKNDQYEDFFENFMNRKKF